eukprot:gene1188-2312_t
MEVGVDERGDHLINNVDFQGTSATAAYEAATNVNYFYTYAFITEQKKMLSDHVRMKAYRSAIFENKDYFAGKVVLDVGSGSGILAMWCAQAGASKVYAVEYTDMAKHARELVKRNGLDSIITVIQSSMEDVQLDEKVDIIISEWMGMLLLRESMLDSVVKARDRFLKPNGTLWPSHATVLLGALSSEEDRIDTQQDLVDAEYSFIDFSHNMKELYGVNMDYFKSLYTIENENYFIYNSLWRDLNSHEIIGEPAVILTWDLHKVTLEDIEGIRTTNFSIKIPSLLPSKDGRIARTPSPLTISGFAGWFTVDFNGSDITPAVRPVRLSTGPEMGYTHWGQQVMFLKEPLYVREDDIMSGRLAMKRRIDNRRTYNILLDVGHNNGTQTPFVYELP